MSEFVLKYNKIILYVSTVIISALMLFVFKVSFYMYIGIAFGFIIAFIFFVSYNANKCVNRIIRKFDRECNPEEFVKNLEDYYNNCKRYGLNKDYLLLNLACGYMESGDYKKAIETLEGVEIKQITFKYVKYANLFECYVELREKEKAEEIFGKLEEMLKNIKNNTILLQLMQAHSFYRIRYYYCMQNFKEAEKICDDVWNKYKDGISNSRRMMVSFLFLRGRICMELGQHEDAKNIFSKVIETGNKLYIVNQAKKYLEVLNKIA